MLFCYLIFKFALHGAFILLLPYVASFCGFPQLVFSPKNKLSVFWSGNPTAITIAAGQVLSPDPITEETNLDIKVSKPVLDDYSFFFHAS